jgi:hypothetical protein
MLVLFLPFDPMLEAGSFLVISADGFELAGLWG